MITIQFILTYLKAMRQAYVSGNKKNPSYTKTGPGRYHQHKTKAVLKAEYEAFKASQKALEEKQASQVALPLNNASNDV